MDATRTVDANCTDMWVGYAYCVAGGPTPTQTAPGTSTTANAAPGPTQSGVTSQCSEWYVVQSGDSCPKIESAFGITFAQFYQWNPAIGSTCTNLWVGYAECVKGPS